MHDLQPKTEPDESPPTFDSSGHRNLNDMGIPEIVSVLRADVDRAEEVLMARDAKHKADIGSLQEKYELERLMRLQAEQELKKKEEHCQKLERENLKLMTGLRKRKRVDDDDDDDIDDSNVVAELRNRVAELEDAEDADKRNLENIENLRAEHTKLAPEKNNASVGGNTEGEPHDPSQRNIDTGHTLGASVCVEESLEKRDKTAQNNLYHHDNESHNAARLDVQYIPVSDEDSMQQMLVIHQRPQTNSSFDEVARNKRFQSSTFPNRGVEWEQSEEDYESSEDGADDDVEDGADGEGVSNNVAMPHLNKEPSFMRDLDLEAMHAPEFPQYANMGVSVVDGELFIGRTFNNREDVIRAIKKYNIDRGVDYKVLESEPKTFYCRCIHYKVGCGWLVRVSFRKNKGFWEIRKYNGAHTCTVGRFPQDHSKLDSDTIAQFIEPMVQSDSSLKVKIVMAEVKSQYGYMTTYRKAWAAKQKAIEKVFGNWEHSYEELPQWCGAMCAAVPGSIVMFDVVDAYHGDELMPNFRLFRRMFWTFGPCIEAFKYCKPLVQVDGTHLYGKYKGTMLLAVAQDGNQNILPIGFAVVEGETVDAWHFFLDHLRRHVVTRDGVGIISDHHESIKAAITQSNGQWEPPKAFHMYCIRHIAANFLRRFKMPNLHRIVVSIGYSRIEREFNYHYKQMLEHGSQYTDWLDEIPRKKWVQAFDGGHRWGHMTTNLVECINSVLKGVRNLPITALIKATYFRLAELFARKGQDAYAKRNAGHEFSEAIMTRLQENQQAAKNMDVVTFDRHLESFLVKERSNRQEYTVDLRNKYCDCGDFQIDRYPCSHVIACCDSKRFDHRRYVDDVYRIREICKVYQREFGIVMHQSSWPLYRGPTICANPALKRTVKGRPKSTRYLNEMDTREMRGPRHCGLCQGIGHSRSRCPYTIKPSS